MKIKFIDYHVSIKIEKQQLIRINRLLENKVKIIKQDKDYFLVKILEKDLSKIDQKNVPYEFIKYLGAKQLYFKSIKNISVIIGVVLFLLIIYFNTLTIKDITFSTNTKDNERIEEIIQSHMKSYYQIHYLDTDINRLNLLLRKEFSHFEWISVTKEGCVLKVKILEPSIINKQVEHVEGAGDLVANSDGIIKFFKVSHGIPMVEINQFVRKGDTLVSGNLRIKNSDESTFYIPAQGKVFAEVWYTKTIEVKKEEVKTEYTGRIITEKSLRLFSLDLKYKSSDKKYENFDVEEKIEYLKIFNFKLPFGLKKIHYLEKDDIINTYDDKTSYESAYSKVRYDFLKQLSEEDEILEINMINKSMDDTKYTYVFFVKTYEDIALFQRRNMNE